MYCPKCGKQLSDQSVFCTGCGAKLNAAAAQAGTDRSQTQTDRNRSAQSGQQRAAAQTQTGRNYAAQNGGGNSQTRSAQSGQQRAAAQTQTGRNYTAQNGAGSNQARGGAAQTARTAEHRGGGPSGGHTARNIILIAVGALVLLLILLFVLGRTHVVNYSFLPEGLAGFLNGHGVETTVGHDWEDDDDDSDDDGGIHPPKDDGETEPDEPTPTPAEEEENLSVSEGEPLIIVDDRTGAWSSLSGAARRLSYSAGGSVLAVTMNVPEDAYALQTLLNYIGDFTAAHPEYAGRLGGCVAILIDPAVDDFVLLRRSETGSSTLITEGVDGDAVRALIAIDDYEGAVQKLIDSAFGGEPTTTPAPTPTSTPEPTPTPTPTPTEAPSSGDYILPNSDTVLLTRSDLAGLTWRECSLARNEIYARHGRMFATQAIADYFNSKSWYHGTIPGATFDANSASYLSTTERSNIALILQYEKDTWGGSYF